MECEVNEKRNCRLTSRAQGDLSETTLSEMTILKMLFVFVQPFDKKDCHFVGNVCKVVNVEATVRFPFRPLKFSLLLILFIQVYLKSVLNCLLISGKEIAKQVCCNFEKRCACARAFLCACVCVWWRARGGGWVDWHLS